MALNMNKEISLDTIKNLFNRSKDKDASPLGNYPTKTTMNLYQTDAHGVNLRTLILGGVLGVLVLVAFVKFGILDQMAAVAQKQAELTAAQDLVAQTSARTVGYDEVLEVYEGYTASYGNASVDAMRVLDLVEQQVMPNATVTSITISGTTLTLSLANVSLDTVGNLAKVLETQDMVSAVNVQTASTQNASSASTTAQLVVSLVGNSEEEV